MDGIWMDIYKLNETESFQTSEGTMTPQFADENVSILHLSLPAGLQMKPHSHPSTMIMIMTKGFIKVLGKEATDIRTGDLAYFPGGTEMGLDCYEESEAILLTIPSRYKNTEDFRETFKSYYSNLNPKGVE
jgi:quercetin dioxygenase-like cupin family protein